jgi:hypothetical protein
MGKHNTTANAKIFIHSLLNELIDFTWRTVYGRSEARLASMSSSKTRNRLDAHSAGPSKPAQQDVPAPSA